MHGENHGVHGEHKGIVARATLQWCLPCGVKLSSMRAREDVFAVLMHAASREFQCKVPRAMPTWFAGFAVAPAANPVPQDPA